MKLTAKIRRYFLWRVIDIGLRRNAPTLFQTSGEVGRRTNVYAVFLLDCEGELRFVANEMQPSGLTGKWSDDGKICVRECSIPYSSLGEYRLYIQHYYRGWAFYSLGVPSFVWKYVVGYPFLRVGIDRIIQRVFNLRPLPRHDRMKILKYILAETIKDRNYKARDTQLLTHFYSVRWVHRKDKEALMTYYTLLLSSLTDSHDLAKADHGYTMRAKALNTIADYEKEERRHGDNYKVQRGIFYLTVVLMAVGIIQAATGGFEAWQDFVKPTP